MTDKIYLNEIRVMAICGALPEEQLRKQPFQINVEIETDLAKAGESDDLSDTVDYGLLCDCIAALSEGEKFQLIERFAQRIVEACFDCDERINAISVSLKKLNAPVEILLESASVSIRRQRSS